MKKTKEVSKETKERILKNAGQAIEKFRKLKGLSVILLAKKSEMNISTVNDICQGKLIPNKHEVKSLYKAMDVPKEMILLYTMEEQDVAENKRELFNQLIPSIKGLVEDVFKDEKTKDEKSKKEKAKKSDKTKVKKSAPKKVKAKKVAPKKVKAKK